MDVFMAGYYRWHRSHRRVKDLAISEFIVAERTLVIANRHVSGRILPKTGVIGDGRR